MKLRTLLSMALCGALLLTGWDEPWHYRYVGKEVATFIMEQGICYEEFYAHYFPDFQY